jgi:hypothetical protein
MVSFSYHNTLYDYEPCLATDGAPSVSSIELVVSQDLGQHIIARQPVDDPFEGELPSRCHQQNQQRRLVAIDEGRLDRTAWALSRTADSRELLPRPLCEVFGSRPTNLLLLTIGSFNCYREL